MKETDIRTIKRLVDIKAALTKAAMTVRELAAAIHINRRSASDYMRNLHTKGVFVERWNRDHQHITAVYRWGNLPDAPKPVALTAIESDRGRVVRMRKDADAYDRYLSYHRAKHAEKKAKKHKNSWASALFVGVRAGSMSGEG